jgi:hypothetical protein
MWFDKHTRGNNAYHYPNSDDSETGPLASGGGVPTIPPKGKGSEDESDDEPEEQPNLKGH